MHRRILRVALLSLVLVACGGGDTANGGSDDSAPDTDEDYAAEVPDFGNETSAVVVANPTINEGSATSVEAGDARSVEFSVDDRGPFQTDETGLASITGLSAGSHDFAFDSGAVPLDVQNEGEHYDLVVATRDGGTEYVVEPIRYAIGGEIKRLEDGDSLEDAVAEEDVVVFLGPGTYDGNFELRSENVLIFGAWSPEEGPRATIEGDLRIRGGGNRLRSVEVTGTLSSPANGFSAAFSRFGNADISGNNVTLIRNDFTDGDATVPSSSAVLVGNDGIP